MKKIIIFLGLMFIISGCSLQNNNSKNTDKSTTSADEGIVDVSDYVVAHDQINNTPIEALSTEEKSGLIKMREEEKLAHDVYITLYEKWNLNAFRNISGSELTHTDSIRYLIEKYNLEDPVKDNAIGVFTNKEFSDLYLSLVAKGNNSLTDAVVIGLTIEDLDIRDLQDLIKSTDNEDIKIVYNNLMRGSRNHLRSFSKQLSKLNTSYTAQYLTQKEIDDIINSPQERGQ